MTEKAEEEHTEFYADGIASEDAKVPGRLLILYAVLPIWGIVTFYLYWNGSSGWLDRGYWQQLQKAANTTVPYINENNPVEKK